MVYIMIMNFSNKKIEIIINKKFIKYLVFYF